MKTDPSGAAARRCTADYPSADVPDAAAQLAGHYGSARHYHHAIYRRSYGGPSGCDSIGGGGAGGLHHLAFGGLSYAAAMGFNVLTAQRVGGGRLAEARNILKQALVLCLAFSVVMAALAAALSAPLPGMLRADRDIGRMPPPTFLVYSLFLPALQLDNVAAGQLQATGNMRTPGICMVVMCALDVVFNTLFIFLPALSGSAR